MENMYYIGLDVHKKTISYCMKDASGRIHTEGTVPATRFDLDRWMKTLPQPWTAAMEATMFSGWIYDHLRPHAAALKVAHPLMLRAIAAAKKKNDRIDANKISDGLRCDFLPECYMASTGIRERRRTLRYRNLLVHQAVQLKNKISGLLMEAGVSYNKQKLHKVGYFKELLATNPDIHEGLRPLLRICRETLVRLQKTESALVRSLQRDSLLAERVEQLMTIPAVGPITALTWALEVGDVKRFSSIKKAISYCGLCGAEKSSAETIKRTPISKQRNKHLQSEQSVLVEAAKMAPRLSPELALIYDREKQKGNANRATLAVARKLVAYLVAIDRSQRDFLVVEKEKPRSCLELPRKNERVYSTRGLPGLAVADWVTELRLPILPSDCFKTGRRSLTQSSVEADRGRDSKWMSGSARRRNNRREAQPRAEELEKPFYALLLSVSGELFLS